MSIIAAQLKKIKEKYEKLQNQYDALASTINKAYELNLW